MVTGWDAAQAAFTLHDGGECPRVTLLGDLVEQIVGLLRCQSEIFLQQQMTTTDHRPFVGSGSPA